MKEAWLAGLVFVLGGASADGVDTDLLGGLRRRGVGGSTRHEDLGEVARHGEEAPPRGLLVAAAVLPLGGDGRPRRLPRRRRALRGRPQEARRGNRRDEAGLVEEDDEASSRRGWNRCRRRDAARVVVVHVITVQRETGSRCLGRDAAGLNFVVDEANLRRRLGGAHGCCRRRDAAGVGSVFSFLSACRPRQRDAVRAGPNWPDHGQF